MKKIAKISNRMDTDFFITIDKILEEIDVNCLVLRKIGTNLDRQKVPDLSLALVLACKLLDGERLLALWIDWLFMDWLVDGHIQ